MTWTPPVRWRAASGLPSVADVRNVMWRHCGLLRDGGGVAEATRRLEGWYAQLRAATAGRAVGQAPQSCIGRLGTVALLMARAALRREESRGGHFRTDFPDRDDIHWQKHVSDVLAPA